LSRACDDWCVSLSTPMRDLRILISGAGIGGPALAFWLRRYGFLPTLIERAPAFRDGGYMIDVWGLGWDLVERMGLLGAARDRGYVIDRLVFVDERGRQVSGFDADVFRRALAGRFFSIPRGDLARLIYDAVGGDVPTLYSTSIDAMREHESGVDVDLSNGSSQTFDLVVGADGLRSRVRECVFGAEKQFEKYLGYYAASFVTTGYPHRDERTYLSFARPGRQISRYAMRGDRSAFLFVFAEDDMLDVAPHDMAAHRAVLRARFGGDRWECSAILARLDAADDVYFDSVSQIRMPRWSAGRKVLIGDAAHCPSLLAGAGSAFAMLGAYVLAGELKQANGDHAAAFAAYEGCMRPFIEEQQTGAVQFARWFAPKTAFGMFLRNSALNLMRFQPFGTWFSRHVFAGAFDLPDYA
jgi:2-polyprenyl-6-methoxyphenol hydroxylase-like FAD-dependent oxidoreductase